MVSKALVVLLVCLSVGVATARSVRSTDVGDNSPKDLKWQHSLTDEEKEWFSGLIAGDKNGAMKRDKIAEILAELNKVQPGIAKYTPRIYQFLVNPELVPFGIYENDDDEDDYDDDDYDSDEDEE